MYNPGTFFNLHKTLSSKSVLCNSLLYLYQLYLSCWHVHIVLLVIFLKSVLFSTISNRVLLLYSVVQRVDVFDV